MYYITITMVSIRKMGVGVAYLITLAVRQEVHSVANPFHQTCNDTLPGIALCNPIMKWNPWSYVHTRSVVCAPNVRVYRKHSSLLFIADMII